MRRFTHITITGIGIVLLLFNCGKNPTSARWTISLVGSYVSEESVVGVFVEGSYAYILEGFSLEIIDITDPGDPTLAGRFETLAWGQATDVYVVGDYAYLTTSTVNDGSLLVVDVSQPTNPALTGYYQAPRMAFGVCVAGHYVYIANGHSGLEIVDVEDPANPVFTANFDILGMDIAYAVTVVGSYAYVLYQLTSDFPEYWTLLAININNPVDPTLSGSYESPGSAGNLCVAGDFAYIPDIHYIDAIQSDGGLKILDISNPAAPELAGEYIVFTGGRKVAVGDDIAYFFERPVENHDTRLLVLRVTDPSNPILIESTTGIANCYGIFVREDYVYIADGDQGLLIFRCALLWPI